MKVHIERQGGALKGTKESASTIPKFATNDPGSLAISSTSTSASAALARSIFLYAGFMFRRPSKLFRPSRVDTWGGLRHLATSANQSLSPTFIRSLLKTKSGMLAVLVTMMPPLIINTVLGFLLFSSHSMFALELARFPYFRKHETSDSKQEDLTFETLLRGPSIIPNHPTLLSAIAGAGAGVCQGLAFTPVENVVKLLRDSATSLTGMLVRGLRLPIRPHSPLNDVKLPPNPLEALRKFVSSDAWKKSPSWWSGWRWTVARDSASYAVFFAAFDVSRRIGLRVKALFGGPVQQEWKSFTVLEGAGTDASRNSAPTIARVAQAGTIVAGGISASLGAEVVGRPFRVCQMLLQQAKEKPFPSRNPILSVLRTQGLGPFIRPQRPVQPIDPRQSVAGRMARKFAWRLAAVGPWGLGFLAWAWVGGEV